jgi:hypothetical protein
MKNALSLLLVLTSLLLLSCEKEKPEPTDISTKITINTAAATNIEYRRASINGTLGVTYERTVQDYGHCWDTLTNPELTKNKTSFGSQMGTKTYMSQLSNLAPGKLYYTRAYFTIDNTTIYSTENSFTTKPVGLPVVETDTVKFNTVVSVSCGGNVLESNDDTIIARGVCWNTSGSPTINGSSTNNGNGLGKFTSEISGLSVNTTYYVRAYATNTKNTAYGAESSFKTEKGLPIISTTSISEILTTSAKSGGNITYDGGFPVTARGICWSTSQNPTTANSKTTNGTGTGTFTSSLTGILPNNTYYVRAYATNVQGTAYGNQLSFTTNNNITPPRVTTTTVTSITTTTAQSGGNVTSDGGATVSARGVCWSTSQNPTTANSKTTNGTGTGAFTSSLTGLSPNNTYYVRAYATNSQGTAYGNQLSFTIPPNNTLPKVTTTTVTSITTTTAQSGGNVTSDGGATVSARGVCWSTSQNPTTANSKTNNGTGTGIFTSSLTGLLPNTTYYVRAYAINTIGTSYGNEISFKTKDGVPKFATTTITNITATSATAVSNITDDGGLSITVKGVCWSTSQNPTTFNSKTSNGTGIGTFTSNLTGLASSTTYYVKTYATNTKGTAYSNQVSFTTSISNNNPPVITSSPVLSIYEDVPYSYTLTATDADAADVLTYRAITKPSWLSFNTSTHILSGTPSNSNVGNHYVSLSVSDGKTTIYNNFTITVNNVNDAPVITSTPATSVAVNTYYSYQITATDVDMDILSYYAPTKPSWLSFSSAGLLSGTPALADIGNHSVQLTVSDGTETVTQSFTINVYQIPYCLYVGDPSAATVSMLNEIGLTVETSTTIPSDLSSYTLVMVGQEGCNPTTANYIEQYVRNGGGVLVDGAASYYFAGNSTNLSNISAWFGASTYSNIGNSYAQIEFDNPLGTDLLSGDTVGFNLSWGGASTQNPLPETTIISTWDYDSGNIHSYIHPYYSGRVSHINSHFTENSDKLYKALCQWASGIIN